MKISELIAHLQAILEAHGDATVEVGRDQDVLDNLEVYDLTLADNYTETIGLGINTYLHIEDGEVTVAYSGDPVEEN